MLQVLTGPLYCLPNQSLRVTLISVVELEIIKISIPPLIERNDSRHEFSNGRTGTIYPLTSKLFTKY